MAAKKAATEEIATAETTVPETAAPAAGQPRITIDGVEHLVADLSDAAKGQIQSLRYIEAEMARLQAQAAVLNTAKQAYGNNLKRILAPSED
jgi:hypothetical protein